MMHTHRNRYEAEPENERGRGGAVCAVFLTGYYSRLRGTLCPSCCVLVAPSLVTL